MTIFKQLSNIYKLHQENKRFLKSIPDPQDCLVKKVSLAEAEQWASDKIIVFVSDPKSEYQEWLKMIWNPFIFKLKDGDELWLFSTPSIYWEHLMGKDGFVILRDKRVVAALTVSQS